MKRSLQLIALLLATFCYFSQAQDQLRIQDPQQTWRNGRGTIEQAAVAIRPQGLYMEIGLYLTLSARGLSFSANDSLEVQLFFDLPREAIVHDLWLWVEDEIMRALIMDVWTASSIYEGIVKRRRDPAILFKRDDNSYELRIYPLAGNESRKVKLTYLVPAHWSKTSVASALPVNLIKTSRTLPKGLDVLYWPHPDWLSPRILEVPDLAFQPYSDPTLGDYLISGVSATALTTALTFELDSPMTGGVYISRLGQGSEGIYQLAVLPAKAFDLQFARKSAILVDYDASKSNYSASEVLTAIKALLHSHFTAADSFNLIFSGIEIKRAGESWLAADSATVENVFANLGANPIASFSSLPPLMGNGLDFVTANGSDGCILLVANSDQVGDFQVANPLVDDLRGRYPMLPPIFIADFNDRNVINYRNGGRTYAGNGYFYENLSRLTYGHYDRLSAGKSLFSMLSENAAVMNGFIDSFDLYTTLENGFCFGRFNLGTISQTIYLDQPILQVGKFLGDFPFVINASGLFNGAPFSRTLTIAEEYSFEADSLAEEVWIGNHLAALEMEPRSNSTINQIIDLSVRERVLSIYTAFLALEPSDTVKACVDCFDETELIPTSVAARDEAAPSDSVLQAYPNPFNAATTLRITIPARLQNGEGSLRIYNVMGQIVKTFDLATSETRRQSFVWNGYNDAHEPVATGNYYVVLQTPHIRHTLKLLMLK